MRVHCSATLGPDEGSSPLVTTDIPAPHLNSHTDTVLSSKQATAVLLEWRVLSCVELFSNNSPQGPCSEARIAIIDAQVSVSMSPSSDCARILRTNSAA
jgi:hypothetical protein